MTVVCRVTRAPSRAGTLLGYLPHLSGYNGENGLVQAMRLEACRAGTECGTETGADCHLVAAWQPGQAGEEFPGGAGPELSGTSLRLTVTYR